MRAIHKSLSPGCRERSVTLRHGNYELPRTLRVLVLGSKLGTLVRDPLVTPDGAIGSGQLLSNTPSTTCNDTGDSLPETPKAGVGRSNRLGGTTKAQVIRPGLRRTIFRYAADTQ